MPEGEGSVASLWVDKLWTKVKKATGACAANQNLDDIKDYLKRGEQVAWAAALMEKGEKATKLQTASEHLGKVHQGLDLVKNLCLDVKAIEQIHEAIKVLNDPNSMKPGSDEAAKAFGQLFVGAGRFASKAGPPVSAYAQILENAGDFFVNMLRGLDPMKKPGAGGPQLRQLEREGYNG